MLENLWNLLDDREREAISPILRIDETLLDPTESSFYIRNGFLMCSFVSKAHDRCPFQLSFGRGEESGRFNFFIGRGAEFYNFELFNDEESRAFIKRDLRLFLTSVIECRRVIVGKGVAVEHYLPSKILLDGSPLRFTFRDHYGWPFARRMIQTVTYRAWVD